MNIIDKRNCPSKTIRDLDRGDPFMFQGGLWMKCPVQGDEQRWDAISLTSGFHRLFETNEFVTPVNATITIHD